MRSKLLLVVALAGALGGCGLVASGSAGGQPPPRPQQSPPARARPLVIDMTGYPPIPPGSGHFDVQKGLNLAQYVFDANRDGEIDDREQIRKRLDASVPKTFTGVLAIDWEHPVFEWFAQPPDSPKFQRAMRNFQELLIHIRRLRPYARIGFFGLPKSPYWKRDEAWRERSLAMADLLKHADWVGPRVYHPHKTGEIRSVTVERQRDFIVDSTKIGLEVGRIAGNKPVYIWVTHRHSPNNKFHPNERVDDTEFVDTLRIIMETEYRGRRVDGVIWWAADKWYHEKGKLPAGERAGDLRPLHRHYFELIADVLGSGGK